jgi:hypothetical protein
MQLLLAVCGLFQDCDLRLLLLVFHFLHLSGLDNIYENLATRLKTYTPKSPKYTTKRYYIVVAYTSYTCV